MLPRRRIIDNCKKECKLWLHNAIFPKPKLTASFG